MTSFVKYSTCNFDDLELGLFKVIQCQWSWCQSKAHSLFPVWPPSCLSLYLSWYSRYLMREFFDLDLRRFKVIQSQKSWCQSLARGRLPIRRQLTQHRIWPWTRRVQYLTLKRRVQGHPRSKVMVPVDSHGWLPIRLLSSPISYLSNIKNMWPVILMTLN